MNKIKLLKFVNFVLGISFLVQAISVVFMVLEKAPGWLYKLHALNGMVFIVLVFVHIALNWAWIRANFLKKKVEAPKSV
ncbi:MAG: DUF4405 domain-containing protein [bacterium]|nr:DUF4405 domain-containing protein [bacterium]MDD5354176.1 DUF4405 domain-containing protein [bacterium]